MHSRKITDLDYIQFLIAAQTTFSCTEAARCQPGHGEREDTPAHDTFTRLLASQPPDTEALWAEVAPLVKKGEGLLILDDTTLDKPYARRMELVTRHWSGKHHRVVSGINLLTLLWTDGRAALPTILPTDFRLYDKPAGGRTKNEHFLAMLGTAQERAFTPRYVCFDRLRLLRQLVQQP
jgi:putative transposase